MEFFDSKYRDICSSVTLYSSKQGFFSEFASSVTEKVGRDWINRVFANQKLEEDKIRICCTDKNVWSAMQETLQNIKEVYREKSAAASRETRLKGDRLLAEKNFKKAAMLYSQSVIRAPGKDVDTSIDKGLSLPLAYRCRANALYQLQQYEDCLQDLNLAMKEGFPTALRYEIYRQMGRCYVEMEQEKKADISLKVALKMVEDQISKIQKQSRDKNDQAIAVLKKQKEEIEKSISDLNSRQSLTKAFPVPKSTHKKGPLPEVTGTRHNKYPNASNLITVKQSADAGRHATAAEYIETGATLVVEEPYASCLIPEMFASHCHHCYSKLNAPVPCNTCSGLAFCGVECRDAALSTYHKYECPFTGMFIGSGMSVLSHLSLRMVTQDNISFFKRLYEKIKSSEADKESNPTFTDKEIKYMDIYNLVAHSRLRLNEDYFKRTLMAIFLVKCLKKTDYFGGSTSGTEELSHDEILTASLILRHLQVLQFNAHEICETRVGIPGKVDTSTSVYVAIGIYPTAALFNHECSPAVARYFHGKNIVIKSIRPIAKDEVVSENYGPIFTKRTLAERVRELSSRYWFKCKCDACVEDWPLMENLTTEHFRLRCATPNCTGLLKYPSSGKRSALEPRCEKCFAKNDLSRAIEQMSRIESLFDRGAEHMKNHKCEKAEPLLETFLNEMHALGVPPNREIALCQEALRTCYIQKGSLWISD